MSGLHDARLIGLSHGEAVQVLIDHHKRLIGCSSSETFLRRCVLSKLRGNVLVNLDDASCLDSAGKRLLVVIATAQGITSDREDWSQLVRRLHEIERPAAEQLSP